MHLSVSPPRRPTIYLVEDDEAVRRALAFALGLEGFEIEAFGSGEALLVRDLPSTPGCLILDHRLPGVSGLETLNRLRARGVGLPAIIVTSHPAPRVREAAARAGAPIIEKPMDAESLARAVERLLADGSA